MANVFAGRSGILAAGGIIGLSAALLQYAGNPANMGICVACFIRDIAGSMGLHQAAVVQYLRPEIPGFVLGSFCAALLTGEFRARAGSAPATRFFLGMCAMAGALVFLGCPWRAFLRLAGGDGNALFGIAGLAVGVFAGTRFFKAGFSLGRAQSQPASAGIMLALTAVALLAMRLFLMPDPEAGTLGWLWSSTKGPGAAHAPLAISLIGGLLIGVLAQRSRFCTMGALRDFFLFRQSHLLSGVLAFLVVAFVANLALGQFKPGFAGQPVAHTDALWNFLGMVASGLAFALAGGCPGRQLILAGEGDGDSAVFALGMLVAAALAHTMGWASSPAGIGPNGMAAASVALGYCLLVGFTNISKA
jgi:YedE family putative selenium metabolism protein